MAFVYIIPQFLSECYVNLSADGPYFLKEGEVCLNKGIGEKDEKMDKNGKRHGRQGRLNIHSLGDKMFSQRD